MLHSMVPLRVLRSFEEVDFELISLPLAAELELGFDLSPVTSS